MLDNLFLLTLNQVVLIFQILLCLITYVACQDDQCDPTVDEDQLEYFENDPETKAPDE